MSLGSPGTNFSGISIKIQWFSLKKMHLKMSTKWPPFCSCLSMLEYQLSIWQITNSQGLNPVPLYVRCCFYIKDMSLECYPTFTKCHWIIHPTTVSEQIELYMKYKGMQLRRCYYLRSYCEIWLTPWVLKKQWLPIYMHFLSTKHGNLIIEMTKICIFVSFVSLVASSEEH